MLRYLVYLARLVRKYANHLMDAQAPGGRLDQQISGSKTEIVNGGPILFVVPRESQTHDTERKHGRGLRPRLIPLYQTGEEPCELLRVFPRRNKIAPRLFVIGGRCRASRLKQGTEVALINRRYCQMLWMGEVRRRFPEPSIHP